MPSELDAHDILFSPLKKRRAEQAARRTADKPDPTESTPVRSRADREVPATDRAVAYAISELAEADAGPLVSSKLIGAIAVIAAIATAAVLMRTPKLETSADDEIAAEPSNWWTAAREQWADENMRVWPIAIRADRSRATVAAAGKLAPNPGVNAASPPAAASAATPASAAAATSTSAAPPSAGARAIAPPSNAADAPRSTPGAPANTSDNPYSDSPAPRAKKPAAVGTDNPY
jgi:hypothetical protein